MEVIKLIGVIVVILGLIIKFDTLATVVVAGIITGLVAKMNLLDIFTTLGNAFLSSRLATLFVLTLPIVGICERYGLKDKAVDFIKGLKVATAGRITALYMIIRLFASAFSLRIGGHPQFVRPLINPMAYGAAVAKHGSITEKEEDTIKGLCAAAENFGNFFGQNCFIGGPGVLLIVTTLLEQGIEVDAVKVALSSIPITIFTGIIGTIYFLVRDKKLDKAHAKGGK